MTDEPFDAKKVAAECKAKVGRRKRKGEAPAPPVVEPAVVGRGHGCKFKPEMVEQAKKLCQFGATAPEVADFFGVHKDTFVRWLTEYPEFGEAVRIGSAPANERAKMSMYQMAVGYDYVEQTAVKIKTSSTTEVVEVVEVRKHMPANYNANAFFLTNKLPEEFKHRKSNEISGEVTHRMTRSKAEKELADFLKGEAAPAPAKAAPKPH